MHRVEPTSRHKVGDEFKRVTVVKRFEDNAGEVHEFPTWNDEDNRSCAVIALTPEHEVITTYQFRPGPEQWMYELPGGGVEPSEEPKAAAIRELREETGYEPREVSLLGQSCRDAYMNGEWNFFFAAGCTLSAGGQQLDEEEAKQGAEVRLISIEELIKNAKSGHMTDGIAVLMAYEKLKELQYGN